MIFNIEEFEIEEMQGLDEYEQDAIKGIMQSFSNEEEKKRAYEVIHSDNVISYKIMDTRTEEKERVGEISFTLVHTGEPAIGVSIEEKYRRQGIAYRLIVALMNRLHQERGINSFTYQAMSFNEASKGLAEKLGGIIIRSVDAPKELGFSFITYRICIANKS